MPPHDLPADYPERIRNLRARLGLTQSALGELLGVTTGTVSRWESAQLKPTPALWYRIAEAEEHGADALRSAAPALAHAREPLHPYGHPAPPDFSADPEIVRVVAEAHRLTYGHLYNPAFATEVSLIEPLPHQRIAVYEHLLPLPRIRFLLADDPGAGKTIMSGLLIREMLSRRLIRRVLVVPPAGLVANWKREMRTLFGLPFEIVSGSDARSGNPFVGEESNLVIVSVDTLAGDRMFARLKEPSVEPYDMVFFDEAHKLSANRNADLSIERTDRYRLAEAIAGVPSDGAQWSLPWSSRHVLLLTATPHMGREYPFYALWRLLDPDAFGSMEAWSRFSPDARARYFIRRTKEEMVYYNGRHIYPKRISDTFGCKMSADEENLYNLTTDYIRSYYNKARILNRSAARLAMSVFQRRLTSSTWALLKSFERRIGRLDQLIDDIVSGRLGEAELEAKQRKLAGTLADPLDQKTADEEEGEENEESADRALGGVATVSLSELRAERAHVAMLAELAREVDDKGDESKFEQLRTVIGDPRFKDQKVLIFTEHRDTLDFLVRRLEGIGFAGKIATIHGGMPSGEEADVERLTERQDNVELFRRPADQGGATYMVCTDAAAEGINLQFCWLMVNYDIPWNPARLEQRMGRIHRFGQKHDPVHIINLVSDPEKTREGRVLQTLLDKLEKIRDELGQGKVFDVVGRMLEGKSLAAYMEEVLQGKTADATRDLGAKLTQERADDIQRVDRERYGERGDVERELPRLALERTREERLRMMPGYVRRFVEKAAPRVDIGLEGDLDGIFSLRARKAHALDPLLPLMDGYPPEKRNRFSVTKPRETEPAVFFHPGEPIFDRLSTWVTGRFAEDALQGGVFVDARAHEPYAFHLALVTVVRRADPRLPALARPEVVESKLVGIRQNSHISACPVEQLLLLRDGDGVPASARGEAAAIAATVGMADSYARRLGRSLAEERRERVAKSVAEQQDLVRAGYDYEEIDLAEARQRLRDKANAGDAKAAAEMAKLKARQQSFFRRRDEALAVLTREPELFDVGTVEFLARALVVPSSDPEDKRRQDAEIERIAMAVVQAHEEETGGARVIDVHTPKLARAAGLAEYPGFDLLSVRPEGERSIEVKGRARVGEIELSENEWARAATLREKYWLYVVFDCATVHPLLHVVRDPFAKLLLRSRTSVLVASDEILRHSEVAEVGSMKFPKSAARRSRRHDKREERETVADPTKPEAGDAGEGQTDVEKLLALLERWRAEPLGDEDETVAELDRALREDPVRFHDLSDEEIDE